MHPTAPPGYWSRPHLPRKLRNVGAPLAVIIALGTLTVLILVAITMVNPSGAVLGLVLTTLAMTVVIGAYLWLDRWEPEAGRLLILAFLWGASAAVVVSVLAEQVFETVVNPAATADSATSTLTVVLGAPLIEEAAKGAFLLIMMTGRRRRELTSLTDCLVYAGLTAAGFAWLEDIFYIANAETMAASLGTAGLRLLMAPFSHSLFTTFIGIGVYVALQQRSRLVGAAAILAGYLVAVAMHGLWNGSARLGANTYFSVYLLWMVPLFVTAIVLAVHSRRREQRVVAAKLPGMVAAGLVTPDEAGWLGSMRTRRQAVAVARRFGRPAARSVTDFAVAVVELAFVRDRIDRGLVDGATVAQFNDDTQQLRAERAVAEPVLRQMAGWRSA